MKILLKQVLIADPNSAYNGLVKDIQIVDGIIAQVAEEITDADEIIHLENVSVSPGWVDVFAHFCDPGLEYRETIETGAAAAAATAPLQGVRNPRIVPGDG